MKKQFYCDPRHVSELTGLYSAEDHERLLREIEEYKDSVGHRIIITYELHSQSVVLTNTITWLLDCLSKKAFTYLQQVAVDGRMAFYFQIDNGIDGDDVAFGCEFTSSDEFYFSCTYQADVYTALDTLFRLLTEGKIEMLRYS